MSYPKKKLEDMSDHDLLIRVNEQVLSLKEQFDKHLMQHWGIFIGMVLVVAGAVAKKFW